MQCKTCKKFSIHNEHVDVLLTCWWRFFHEDTSKWMQHWFHRKELQSPKPHPQSLTRNTATSTAYIFASCSACYTLYPGANPRLKYTEYVQYEWTRLTWLISGCVLHSPEFIRSHVCKAWIFDHWSYIFFNLFTCLKPIWDPPHPKSLSFSWKTRVSLWIPPSLTFLWGCSSTHS